MLEKLPDGNYGRKSDIIPYKQCQLALDKNPVVKDPHSQVSLFSYINSRLPFQVSLKRVNFMVQFSKQKVHYNSRVSSHHIICSTAEKLENFKSYL